MNLDQVRKLMRSDSLPGRKERQELIETHISWVIINEDYTYKIKKPLRYSFLDFSTVERRKYYCERELVLNKRLAPEMYLDVLPISSNGNEPIFGINDEEIIDYTVRMKTMDRSLQMSELLKKDLVSSDQIKVLAKKIAEFHRNADEVRKPLKDQLLFETFADILRQRDFLKARLGYWASEIIDKVVHKVQRYLNENKEFMSERSNNGFIRDGHGDLHSKNIFLYEDPIIFDCVEFNDSYRHIDILSDLGFCCMDLDAYGLANLSDLLYEHYVYSSGTVNGILQKRLFNYYKCYRANVRAKVNALRAAQATDDKVFQKVLLDVKKYLNLMEGYSERF